MLYYYHHHEKECEKRRVASKKRYWQDPETARKEASVRGERYRENNPEKVKESSLKSSRKNAEKRKIATAAWRLANAEHVKQYQAEYDARVREEKCAKRRAQYAANPEPLRAEKRAWNRANPEWCRANKQKRRALKLAVGGSFTKAETEALFAAQNGLCANPYCRVDLTTVQKHLDHVVALTRGGTNDVGNLAWLCGPCNQRKTNFTVEEWLQREALRCQPVVTALQRAA